MFMEMKNNVKKQLMIHVDMYTKMVIDVPLNNKMEAGCTRALLQIKSDYTMKASRVETLSVYNLDRKIAE